MRYLALFFLGAMLLPLTGTAEAGVYRCDGFVQSRPCDQDFSLDPRRNDRAELQVSASGIRPVRASAPSPATGPGQILKQQYIRLTDGLGHWRGRIRGNGRVHMYLDVFRNGILESTRYMGNVLLTPRDNSVLFSFRGPRPEGSNWSWKIRTAYR